MTAGKQFFTQNLPTRMVAGRLASGAGPVEALTLSDVATQVALALINNTIPQSFPTISGSPSTPASWSELVSTIEAAQTWTIGSSPTTIYTSGFGFFGAAKALSFYSGVVWANEQSGGNADIVDVLNFTASSPLIYQHDFGSVRTITGAIKQQSTPPGLVSQEPPNPDGNVYFMSFNGGISYFDRGGISTESIVRVDEDNSAGAVFFEYLNSSHRIGKYTSVNFAAHTATLTQNILNPGNLGYNSCAIDSRCYVRSGTTDVGWIHTTSGALTTIKSYANACSIPLVGGPFNTGNAIYVQSGDVNKANRIQKLNTAGVLQAEATLTTVGTTDYATITSMAYDYALDHLWVQSGAGLHCISAGTMKELAFIAAASLTAELIQPIGHPNGGAFAFTNKVGSYYTTVGRLTVTAS